MALLQINEPAKKQDQLAIGIDLGTTYSLIAHVDKGKPVLLTDNDGSAKLPSVVHFQKGVNVQPLVGIDAQAKNDSHNTVRSAKRLLGRDYAELTADSSIDANLVKTENDASLIATEYGDVSPVEVSAHILTALKQRAATALRRNIAGAVITVPAYFDDAQRQATKDAAKIAGLPLLRLLNEPTAAALAYGLDKENNTNIAIYDLGGGTFDISILKLTDGVFQVLATGGDTALGGDDIDQLIIDHLLVESGLTNADISADEHVVLKKLACSTKEALSTKSSYICEFRLANSQEYKSELKLETFNQLITPLIERTIKSVQQTITDSNLEFADIEHVVMIGGSTRIPYVQELVGKIFNKQPLNSINPDTAVAEGAAVYANTLLGQQQNAPLLLDVNPLSLGIETAGGLVAVIIKRNSPIPTSITQEFTTQKNNQTAIVIHIVQGERDLVTDCRSLAKIYLRDLPPLPAGKVVVSINFSLDANGILKVTAKEKDTEKTIEHIIKPSHGLTSEDVSKMITASYDYAGNDIAQTKLIKLTTKAKQLVSDTQDALEQDKNLLSNLDQQELHNAVQQLEESINQQDARLIEQQFDKLQPLSEKFAQVRLTHILKTNQAN